MDFNDNAQEAAFRAEARAWLAAHAPAHELVPGEKMPDTEEADRGRAWMRELFAGGWSGLTFPKALGGRGLSGGEAQRVALARLYLRDPRLILLDEPTSHLDWEAERQVLDGLIAFASGRTLLVATHSEAVAARMDRVFRIVHRQLLPAPRPRVWEGLTERGAA